MALLSSLLFAVTLIAPSVAIPNLLNPRATTTCVRDDCLRAVVRSGLSPGPSSALADCSSFLLRTATPCPATSTIVNFVTITVDPTTTTTISTIHVTATETDEVDVTATTTTATTTTTTYTPFAPNSPVLKKRQVATCSPAVSSASSVPKYATTCAGTARYISACSCNGVSATTVTLSPSMVLSTTISTITVTPTTTLSQSTQVTDSTATTLSTTTVTTVGAIATQTVVLGPCASGALFDSYYTTMKGDIYGLCLHTDTLTARGNNLFEYRTPDLSQMDPQTCAEQCSLHAGCKAATFVEKSSAYNHPECWGKDATVRPIFGPKAFFDHNVASLFLVSTGTGQATS